LQIILTEFGIVETQNSGCELMAAVVRIYECSGTLTGVDKTASVVRFMETQSATPAQSFSPVTIPNTATYFRSYTKSMRFWLQEDPVTYIDNFRVYTDGSNPFGSGVSVLASNTGVANFTNASAPIAGAKDLFSFTEESSLNLNSRDYTSSVPAGYTASYFGDLLTIQVSIGSQATSGKKSSTNLTFVYDEQ
jgi:hypothetical protein